MHPPRHTYATPCVPHCHRVCSRTFYSLLWRSLLEWPMYTPGTSFTVCVCVRARARVCDCVCPGGGEGVSGGVAAE